MGNETENPKKVFCTCVWYSFVHVVRSEEIFCTCAAYDDNFIGTANGAKRSVKKPASECALKMKRGPQTQ